MYQSQHFVSLSLYLVGLLITLTAAAIGGSVMRLMRQYRHFEV